MSKDLNKLIKKHHELVHSDMQKVVSHVQRNTQDWIINTIMIDGCEVPFRFKRKKPYKNVEGRRVNLTYYPAKENVAGMELEVMKVVRIKIA
jgi:hypothetical protein